jgi:hypothetical protein
VNASALPLLTLRETEAGLRRAKTAFQNFEAPFLMFETPLLAQVVLNL